MSLFKKAWQPILVPDLMCGLHRRDRIDCAERLCPLLPEVEERKSHLTRPIAKMLSG